MTITILDKKGRKVEHGDLLKVFHFIGARRKKYYMYKIVTQSRGELWGTSVCEGVLNGYITRPDYSLAHHLRAEYSDIEIIDSVHHDFEDRPTFNNKAKE